MSKIININYEALEKVINRDSKINSIFKNIINKNIDISSLELTEKTRNGYRYNKIKEGSKVYLPRQWFYPIDHTLDTPSYYCFDIYTASVFALYYCGGVHAYTMTQNVRLLILDKETVIKIIKDILNPLIRNKNNSTKGSITYYRYMKLYLKQEFEMLGYTELQELEKITSDEVGGNYPTNYFLSLVANKLDFDGVIYVKRRGIYELVKSGLKMFLNSSKLIRRQPTNKYDWTNWGLDNYIVPITEFELNVEHFGKKDIGFNAYNFYRNSTLPSIKITDEYDFGTLNINQLISINKIHTKDDCMKALINFFKIHKLKFICLQEVRYGDAATFNKFIEAEGLYSSVGDFEKLHFKQDDVCNIVVSTSKLIILNNELLPGEDKKHFILFRHPNYSNKSFVNTQLSKGDNKIKQLNRLKEVSTDYILGNLNIVKGSDDYSTLQALGFALNNDNIYGTTLDGIQTDYILSKLPSVLQSVVTVNYKYSDHKALIGKK